MTVYLGKIFTFKTIASAFFIIALLLFSTGTVANPLHGENSLNDGFVDLTLGNAWTDSILSGMTLDEKIGQLFMIPAYSNKGLKHKKEIQGLIEKYHIGGIIFMQGGPVRQANMVNHFQSVSKYPLLMAQDAEWGLGMRLDSTHSFPRQLTLGAVKDPRLIFDFGAEVARQCKMVGIHINFAPVVDINNNINNPVINDRSFGENRYAVTLRGLQYMKGLQQNGVMACAKHFPGHGDTDKDSHHELPLIKHSFKRLDSIELFPFRLMAYQGVMSMMTAHLYIPALDSTTQVASSLSKKIVSGILKDRYNYKGLIITDALSMQGAKDNTGPGSMELKAILAGNDILLFPSDIPKTVSAIKQAITEGEFPLDELDQRVKKILNAKKWSGLDAFTPLETDSLYEKLNNPNVVSLHRQIIAHAATLITGKKDLVPYAEINTTKTATLKIGSASNQEFLKQFQKYADADHFEIEKNAAKTKFDEMAANLAKYDRVIVGLHNMSRFSSKKFGITDKTIAFLNALQDKTGMLLIVYGSPYSLKKLAKQKNILLLYEDTEISQLTAAQILFGGLPAKGLLPVTATDRFAFGNGIIHKNAIRLSYGLPEEVGMDSRKLEEIDRIVAEAIYNKATPGCQILVARNNKVIYSKNFGYHTYENKQRVQSEDLYDLASLTKIVGSTVSIMGLYENGEVNLSKTLADYLPSLANSNLKDLKLKDVMTHTSGLKAWIPFYKTTIVDDTLFEAYYCYEKDEIFCIPVADGLFMRADYRDSMKEIIVSTSLKNPGRYKYSDLGFYLFKEIIEEITKYPMDSYVNTQFYNPLGLRTMTYKPLLKFPVESIVPTEFDSVFRKQVIRGYVHDPGAAMLGGVSGHAGIFSNANDLAVFMQMLLNKGSYGGKRFLKAETIELFTKRQNNKSRRGLGFDKPETNPKKGNPASDNAPAVSFGHTGFTGTCTWVDPKNNLVYVFLSNRIYPTAENRKLISMNIRTRIQDVIYEALLEGTN